MGRSMGEKWFCRERMGMSADCLLTNSLNLRVTYLLNGQPHALHEVFSFALRLPCSLYAIPFRNAQSLGLERLSPRPGFSVAHGGLSRTVPDHRMKALGHQPSSARQPRYRAHPFGHSPGRCGPLPGRCLPRLCSSAFRHQRLGLAERK